MELKVSYQSLTNLTQQFLGVSATVQKPVVLNGEVTVRPIMTLTLTADHRVVDGLEGAKFMKTLKEAIENPLSLLI